MQSWQGKIVVVFAGEIVQLWLRNRVLAAAARGLDVKEVMAVINYDFPNNIEDYVHRSAFGFIRAHFVADCFVGTGTELRAYWVG